MDNIPAGSLLLATDFGHATQPLCASVSHLSSNIITARPLQRLQRSSGTNLSLSKFSLLLENWKC
jgi:hypothetical protein